MKSLQPELKMRAASSVAYKSRALLRDRPHSQIPTACCFFRITFCSRDAEREIFARKPKTMLRAYIVAFVLVAWVCGEAASAYFKTWEDGEAAERSSPYEKAMLQRLQSYLDTEDRQRYADAELPVKRQMRYNQCYFNPISCFKRRK